MPALDCAFTTVGLTAAAVLLLGTTAASAEQPTIHSLYDERRAPVHVVDLDLTRTADAQTLYERILQTARSVCAADQRSLDVQRALHRLQCMRTAVDAAVGRVSAPLLTAIHLQERA